MGLKQDLDTIWSTTQNILFNCNDVLDKHQIHADMLLDLPSAIADVYNVGRRDEWNLFWDKYQEYGDRRTYQNAFSGHGWNIVTFKPKYDIIATGSAQNMFANIAISDLAYELDAYKVKLTMVGVKNFAYAFAGAKIQYLPEISTIGADTLAYMFYGSYNLRSIPLLILREDGSQLFTSTFYQCSKLEELRITGKIGNSINLKWSPLSRASIESVMAALSDTVTGKTVTFKKTAVEAAFETSTGAADGSTSDEWTALVASKPNWTITLS